MMMNYNHNLPPLVRALKASAERKTACFQIPGHKRGQSEPLAMIELIGKDPYLHDVNEIPDLDRFYSPKGPLLEAKKLAAELFGAKETWFLVGGTSCGVQASILTTCSPGETIILPRNSHVSATTGIIFSGATPKYMVPAYNHDWDLLAELTPSQVETAIQECFSKGRKVGAVFVTSPTYNGICNNLSEISEICHSNGIPLIVDEAHGAHFKFHPKLPKTALEQGADIVIQSTHKVLSSLTQSSMLHISINHRIDREKLHKCLHILQTTSASWLLLASLDAARHQLSNITESIGLFENALMLAADAKVMINKIPGISVFSLEDEIDVDPLRITIGVWGLGLSGFQANKILDKEFGIISELVNTISITLVFSLGTTRENVGMLVSGLRQLSKMFYKGHDNVKGLKKMILGYGELDHVEMGLSPREAFFADKVAIKFNEECVGEVCGEPICPYPPGVPMLVPGEVISQGAVAYLQEIKKQGGFIFGAADPLLSTILVCNNNK